MAAVAAPATLAGAPALGAAVHDADARAAARGLRVVSLIDTYVLSGPGRQLVGAAQVLMRLGAEFLVVFLHRPNTPEPPFADALRAAGVPFVVLPEAGPFDPRLPGRVRDVLTRFGPHVVETHSYKMSAVMWLLRRTGTRVPWVGFFHGRTTENAKVRAYHWLDERLITAADVVVGMSDIHRQEFGRRGARIQVIHNAVLPPAAAPAAAPDLAGYRQAAPAGGGTAPGPSRAPLVGVIGRLSPEKGVDVFLDACARLRGAGLAFSAVVVGDGPTHAALSAECSARGLDGVVHFLGPVASAAGLYPQLDLVVIPSRSEGLPNVLLEAVQAGVPVVATRVGAVPEVLDDEPRAGVVVPTEDAAALADAMRARWHTKGEADVHAACGRVAVRFSLDRRIEALLATYGRLTGARS